MNGTEKASGGSFRSLWKRLLLGPLLPGLLIPPLVTLDRNNVEHGDVWLRGAGGCKGPNAVAHGSHVQ